jgi:septum formation protein
MAGLWAQRTDNARMQTASFIYLASQSPRRAQLLDQLGVPHRPLLPDASEDSEALEAERAGELPAAYVERVTRAKLLAARQRLQQRGLPVAPILCADTTVAVGRHILGKPQDAGNAAQMIQALAGRSHRVLTAVAVSAGRKTLFALSTSHVRVAAMSPHDVAAYVASDECFGKAGAYGIQGRFAAHVAYIDGSYTGIMGLPLHETAQLLRRAGLSI